MNSMLKFAGSRLELAIMSINPEKLQDFCVGLLKGVRVLNLQAQQLQRTKKSPEIERERE